MCEWSVDNGAGLVATVGRSSVGTTQAAIRELADRAESSEPRSGYLNIEFQASRLAERERWRTTALQISALWPDPALAKPLAVVTGLLHLQTPAKAVRARFQDLTAEGVAPVDLLAAILTEFNADDPDDGPVIWTELAVLARQHGYRLPADRQLVSDAFKAYRLRWEPQQQRMYGESIREGNRLLLEFLDQ